MGERECLRISKVWKGLLVYEGNACKGDVCVGMCETLVT